MAREFEVVTRFTARDRTSAALRKIGQTAKVASVAIAAGAIMATKMAADFDTGLRKTLTIADRSAVSYNQLSAGVLSLSDSIGVATGEINEAQYQAISAGVETARSLKFVETATKAAIGGFTETTTAVDGLTTVLNAYGLEAEKATMISDQMIATQNFGKTTFGELAQNMGNVIPTAAALGVETNVLLSAYASLTKQGINTAESTTAINAALNTMLKPTSQAIKAAKKMGIEFSAAAVKERGFAQVMQDVAEATGGSEEKLAELFPNVRALKAALVLTGKGAADFATGIDLIGNSTGATQAAFEGMDGPAREFDKALVQLRNSAIRMGVVLIPIAIQISEKIRMAAEAFSQLSPEVQRNSVLAVAGAAALTGFMVVASAVVNGVIAMKTAILGAKAAMTGLNVVMAANPIGAIIAVVLAGAAAFYLMQARVGGVLNYLKVFGQSIMQFILSPINAVVSALQLFITAYGKLAELAGFDSAANLAQSANDAIQGMKDQANLAFTGTTTLAPGSRLVESLVQGDGQDTEEGNKLGVMLGGGGQNIDGNVNINLRNETGFQASMSGQFSGPVGVTLNGGDQ